jgi:hypothetical protein
LYYNSSIISPGNAAWGQTVYVNGGYWDSETMELKDNETGKTTLLSAGYFFHSDALQQIGRSAPGGLVVGARLTGPGGGDRKREEPGKEKPDSAQGSKSESPVCRWQETDSSWAITFGGYGGPGFEFTFGESEGNSYFTFRFGLGGGAGLSYEPHPEIPGPEPNDRSKSGWVLSASGKATFNLGPLGANVELGAARNYNNEESRIYGGPSTSAVSETWGLGAVGSIGGQITHYWGRTKYMPLQPSCHL